MGVNVKKRNPFASSQDRNNKGKQHHVLVMCGPNGGGERCVCVRAGRDLDGPHTLLWREAVTSDSRAQKRMGKVGEEIPLHPPQDGNNKGKQTVDVCAARLAALRPISRFLLRQS